MACGHTAPFSCSQTRHTAASISTNDQKISKLCSEVCESVVEYGLVSGGHLAVNPAKLCCFQHRYTMGTESKNHGLSDVEVPHIQLWLEKIVHCAHDVENCTQGLATIDL